MDYQSSGFDPNASALNQQGLKAIAYQSKLNAYGQVGATSLVEEAEPAMLVKLLFDRLTEHLEHSVGYIEKSMLAEKLSTISKALNIIDGLQLSLNPEASQDLTDNLASLYDYMTRRLLEANLNNDSSIIKEVLGLVKDIASAWDIVIETSST